MLYYTAYDLDIQSNVHLPELRTSATKNIDVTVCVDRVSRLPENTGLSARPSSKGISESYVYSTEDAIFQVCRGREICVTALPKVEDRLIQQAILGTLLGILLFQRGYLVLHASAVVINGKAVVFVGEKGQGKSTTAAAFFTRGHAALADDVVVLDFGTNPPLVLPGVAQLRLWPDSVVASLGADPAALPEIVTGFQKRVRCTIERFAEQPYPIHGIYVLQSGPELQITPLSRQQALIQAVRHTFVYNLLDQTTLANHLQQCAQLVRTVTVAAFERPHSYELLPTVVRLIESQIVSNP